MLNLSPKELKAAAKIRDIKGYKSRLKMNYSIKKQIKNKFL